MRFFQVFLFIFFFSATESIAAKAPVVTPTLPSKVNLGCSDETVRPDCNCKNLTCMSELTGSKWQSHAEYRVCTKDQTGDEKVDINDCIQLMRDLCKIYGEAAGDPTYGMYGYSCSEY